MSTVNQPLRIEDLQLNAQGPSRVVTIKPGQEAEAARISARSGADVVPFNLGGDQMVLAGRGLNIKSVQAGRTVLLDGRAGTVNRGVVNRRNTFFEGLNRPSSVGMASLSTGIGAGVGLVVASAASLLAPFPWSVFFQFTATGAVVGLGLAALAGFVAAVRPVDLKSFSQVKK